MHTRAARTELTLSAGRVSKATTEQLKCVFSSSPSYRGRRCSVAVSTQLSADPSVPFRRRTTIRLLFCFASFLTVFLRPFISRRTFSSSSLFPIRGARSVHSQSRVPHFHYSPCIPLSEQPRIRPVALSTIPLPAVLRRDIGCTIAARQSKNFPYTLPNIAKSPAPPPALIRFYSSVHDHRPSAAVSVFRTIRVQNGKGNVFGGKHNRTHSNTLARRMHNETKK